MFSPSNQVYEHLQPINADNPLHAANFIDAQYLPSMKAVSVDQKEPVPEHCSIEYQEKFGSDSKGLNYVDPRFDGHQIQYKPQAFAGSGGGTRGESLKNTNLGVSSNELKTSELRTNPDNVLNEMDSIPEQHNDLDYYTGMLQNTSSIQGRAIILYCT